MRKIELISICLIGFIKSGFTQKDIQIKISDFQSFEYPATMSFNEAINKDSIKYTGYYTTNTTFTFNFSNYTMVEQFDGKKPKIRRIELSDSAALKFSCLVEYKEPDSSVYYVTFLITDFFDDSMKDILLTCYKYKNVIYGWFTPHPLITEFPVKKKLVKTTTSRVSSSF